MRLIILMLFVSILFGCGTAVMPTKEELAAEEKRVNDIIASRGSNSDATLVSKIGSYSVVDEYYFGNDSENCTYTIRLPKSGEPEVVKLDSGYSYKCDSSAKPVVKMIRILPALQNGVPVDSFAQISLELSEGPRRNYSSTTKVTLADFKSYQTKVAKVSPSELPKIKFPVGNIRFDDFTKLVPAKISKDEFETTEEFERRKRALERLSVGSFYVEVPLTYNADLQTFKISGSCYDNEDSASIKSDVSYTQKSGTNGFGAAWSWSERSGEQYELKWSCSAKYPRITIQMDRETAKKLGDNFVAMLEISVPSQNWTRSRDYTAPEYGRSLSTDITKYSMRGSLIAVYFGDKSEGKTYKVLKL